jgi:plasmid stability protein
MATVHLQLSDDEHRALRARAAAEGISVDELAQRAVRAHLDLEDHRSRVERSAARIAAAHADALERLGR